MASLIPEQDMLSIKIADQDGDVILVVGTENPISIRASSKVLGLASPVFKALFSPNFQEGSQLSSSNPRPISLPEDSPEAVEYLCYILHFQGYQECTSLALFEEMALLCDKYVCVKAVYLWSKFWLRKFAKDREVLYDALETHKRILGQICTSYIFESHYHLWESTKYYALSGVPRIDRDSDYEGSRLGLLLDRLPENLMRK